jgi:hypothetical protein
VIHPEETLADNFALIALGERHGPSPQILAKIRGVLSKGSESAASPDVDN